jgi:hypothetical protein
METIKIRNLERAKLFIRRGISLARHSELTPQNVKLTLAWCQELASEGYPVPPVGIVADLGTYLTLSYQSSAQGTKRESILPSPLMRSYEDYVLGKIQSDWSIERAADAIRRYSGKDLARAISFVFRRIGERTSVPGAEFSPAVFRRMAQQPIAELLMFENDNDDERFIRSLLISQYEEWVRGFRRIGDLLGNEDIVALEQGTALADFSQYIAHRQLLLQMATFDEQLPELPVDRLPGQREIVTRILEEDLYPVGGYASIATKGSIESLLQSQLAFMESDGEIDLFDIRYVRDELFYYSRDENQFLRRRRSFAIILADNLVQTRIKDAALPVQRIILVLTLVSSVIKRLSRWLSTESLHFAIIVPTSLQKAQCKKELELLGLLLHEEIERNVVSITYHSELARLNEHLSELARLSQLRSVHITATKTQSAFTEPCCELQILGEVPLLLDENGEVVAIEAESSFHQWIEATKRMLEIWI